MFLRFLAALKAQVSHWQVQCLAPPHIESPSGYQCVDPFESMSRGSPDFEPFVMAVSAALSVKELRWGKCLV